MSVIATKFERSPPTAVVSIAYNFARKVAVKTGRLFLQAVDTIAEIRMQRARIEVELYCNRYRHTSKMDDDLPVVRADLGEHSPGKPSPVAQMQERTPAQRNGALSVVIAFVIFAAIIAAIIALRLVIWLPHFTHVEPI